MVAMEKDGGKQIIMERFGETNAAMPMNVSRVIYEGPLTLSKESKSFPATILLVAADFLCTT